MLNNVHQTARAKPRLKALRTLLACGSRRSCYLAGALLAALVCPSLQAAAFTSISIASGLGQPLRANVQFTGERLTAQMDACLSSQVRLADGTLVAIPTITITPNEQGAVLALATTERVIEPLTSLIIENRCSNTIRREFMLLLDPPFAQATDLQAGALAVHQSGALKLFSDSQYSRANQERLRRFIVAKQTSQAHRDAAQSVAAAARQTPGSHATAPSSALKLSTLIAEEVGIHKSTSMQQALADGLVTPAAAAAPPARRSADAAHSEKQKALQGQDEQGMSGQLLAIIGGVLVVSLGIIALLRGRVKHQKQAPVFWDWEEDEPGKNRDETQSQNQGETRSEDRLNRTREPSMPERVEVHNLLPRNSPPLVPTTSMQIPVAQQQQAPLTLDPMVAGPIQRYGLLATVATTGAVTTDPTPSVPPIPFLPTPATLQPTLVASKAHGKVNARGHMKEHEDLHFPELPVTALALEEISDVMEEAEFWIALQDPKRAVDVLEPYTSVEPAGSPMPWLYLFDLYRELDDRQRYDHLRERFHRFYNARILSWDDQARSDTTMVEHTIEDVPHIQSKITALWQSEQIVPYLESLLIDDRYGTRAGFALPIFREIMFLVQLANQTRSIDMVSET